MSDTHLNGAKSNGTGATEVKTPFLIGVAGGTASGKVFDRNIKIKSKCVLPINRHINIYVYSTTHVDTLFN